MGETMMAGFGRREITPKVGARLVGYPNGVVSTSVNDALRATALYLSCGKVSAMMISVEVAQVLTALSDRVRKAVAEATGVKAENVLLSATHTHSGPTTMGLPGWGETDTDYCDTVFVPRIVEAAREAVRSPQPVKVGVGTIHSEAGINRRQLQPDGSVWLGQNPWGIFDPTMTVVALDGTDGKPFANLVHYGAHCTAAYDAPCVSRDWAGVMLDVLERETGAPSLFVQGALGDTGPRLSNGKTIGALPYIYEIGHIAGLDAVRAYRGIKAKKSVTLNVLSDDVALPLKTRIPHAEAQKRMEAAQQRIAESALYVRQADYYARIVQSYRDNLPEQTHARLPQTLLALGDIAIVPFPFEMFSEIFLRLRACSPFPHTLCLSSTNGCYGYFPSQDQLCRSGYEIEMFATESLWPWVDNLDTHIILENRKLLEKVKHIC
ncbi:MAG: neutral/alkaline non-lysosomal ceramidase N-terminal domain-containing protein [Kiritimatiellaeota bacterium]|nr:neutral/alkaline non-lysosomal ceramidase N-terminal domain-containing protein [Kiritimatiellota bacterium]